ncbi:uncharacterized protein EDB93DRAFT_1299032 [Suillus bovinus]|uniref:uncharacterized protein n=1 Tax=Suillus bovinus TaxID=48563 RepID=UPI001B865280|nr:uncharacterized protein EDB93DRAFT_1255580 [Suillus bovinus]XP_041304912.1 uncharacterized protein EDB93DRAFT_1299032 [Suillus bovinus]KAG2131231.1 hypothetical protein EDB93DRAFT_1255580 [Suillus bovinus]KAG2139136.1 hypothetical protein EDB93DRAFT_1299032 [Suillus bovinus]
MPGSLEERHIRLEVISGHNLKVPSWRMPAGIYVSINVDSRRYWKSTIGILSPDESVAWGDSITLLSHASPALSVEMRASYELGQMLGSGEVVGKLRTSWDELLNHGDEPFDLIFPPVYGVHPSLTLKAAVVYARDDHDGSLFDSLVDSEITRDTNAGYVRFAEYMTSKTVSHLNDAMRHFQLVLDQCPIDHPDHAGALTNLAFVRLEGYIQDHLQDIDITTSLFRKALALRPQGHPLSLCDLIRVLICRHSKESAAIYIHESAQLCSNLLPLCPEGSYLRSMHVDSVVGYVICNLPIDASDEGIHLRRNLLELCPLRYQLRPRALHSLALALETCFQQCGRIDDIDETIQLRREVASLCPEGHSDRGDYLLNLGFSPEFDRQGKPNDLDEVSSLYEEALRLCTVVHQYRDFSLDNLGYALVTHFHNHKDTNGITQAISLLHEALTLHPPGHPHCDTTLNNLALARHKI